MVIIGHFRVVLCLCYKTSLRAKPLNENDFDLHENGREDETHFHMNGFFDYFAWLPSENGKNRDHSGTL